jgi:aminobenzoyl-glutamate utilization protein A
MAEEPGRVLRLAGRSVKAPSSGLVAELAADVGERQLCEDRRAFHKLAELGWHERRTSQAIVRRLAELGYTVTAGDAFLKGARLLGWDRPAERPGTGCIAELDTGRPGPVVCVRVDIDALPIDEAAAPHRPTEEGWASEARGVMHACGHDGHIAIGLGLARVLAPIVTSRGTGRLRLVFQPAEEGVRGGRAVVDAGWMRDVDLLLGFHIGFGVPAGTIAVGVSGFLATQKWRVRLTGRAAHAGKAPEQGRNALLGACQITLALHALAQSSAPGLRVNVGRLQAGRALNIVPDQAEMLVELRAERSSDLDELAARARRLIEGIATGAELRYSIELIGEAAEWANPPELVNFAAAVAKATRSFEALMTDHIFGASEDATLLARAVADRGGLAGYFLLGADLKADHHTPDFDFDEEVLSRGVRMLSGVVASAMTVEPNAISAPRSMNARANRKSK